MAHITSKVTVLLKVLPVPSFKCSLRSAYAVGKRKEDFFEEKQFPRVTYEEATLEKKVEIYTCGPLFEKWRKEKKYWSVPSNDLHFTVKYIDTGYQDQDPDDSPIVLALHGSPGSYKNFEAITSLLFHQGVRVISPCFPGSNVINPRVFRHTPEEKCEYIKDFLQALCISRIDLILCHSSALFPGQLLCLQDRAHSLCLLNPTAFEVPRKMSPFWLYHNLIRLSEFPIGRQVADMAGSYLKTKSKMTSNYEDQFLSCFTMVHSSIPKQAVHFQRLLQRNFPVMMAFGENDKLIHKTASYKMAKMMISEEAVQKYDSNGQICRAGGNNPFRKVLSFENGSHYIFKKYPEIISKAVSSFLFQHFPTRVS